MNKKIILSTISATLLLSILVISGCANTDKEESLGNQRVAEESKTSPKKDEPKVVEPEANAESPKEVTTDKPEENIEDNKKENEPEPTNHQPKNNSSSGTTKPNTEKSSPTTVQQQTENKPTASTKSPSQSSVETKSSVTTKNTTATQSIPFQTIRENDSSLEKGKEVVAQNGQTGVKTIAYKETYVNGKLSSKEVVSSTVTKQPVNKIVKVGTKEVQATPTYLSASQAKSILSSSGVFSVSGHRYTHIAGNRDVITVSVGSNHVSSIYYDGGPYQTYTSGTEEMYVEAFGPELGKEMYDDAQKKKGEIERAVRAAANAVYGSGTAKANELYSQIMSSSETFDKSF